jgi:hypothetical protein
MRELLTRLDVRRLKLTARYLRWQIRRTEEDIERWKQREWEARFR